MSVRNTLESVIRPAAWPLSHNLARALTPGRWALHSRMQMHAGLRSLSLFGSTDGPDGLVGECASESPAKERVKV